MKHINRIIVTLGLLVGLGVSQCLAQNAASAPAKRIQRDKGWFAPAERQNPAPELPGEVTKAFIIPIRTTISPTLYDSIKRKVAYCKSKGAEIVIFDMDTPGGHGGAMLDIANLITRDLEDVYTVAYVNPQAISAGAVISLACSEIVMAPVSSIGDAMPIMVSGGQLQPIPKAERAKIESYMRAQVRTLAQRNGHNEALCEGMITMQREVWLIRNTETRELKLIDPDEGNWREKVSGAPAIAQKKDDEKAKVSAPANTAWEFLHVVDGSEEIVTLTANEAYDLAFVHHLLPTMADVQEHYNITAAPEKLIDTWSETLVAFLTSPAVTSILLMAGIFFLYIEINTPGLGLPGGLALLCFAILFGSRYLTGLAQWWEIGLFVVGLILLGVELFILPGFGVAGIAGLLCCLIGLLAMVVPNAPDKLPLPSTDLDWDMFSNGLVALGIGFVAGVGAAALVARYLPRIPFANRLVLAPAQAADNAPVSEVSPLMRIQEGDEGIVEGTCRPVGMVRFGADLIDAIADGAMIEKGRKVKVIRREGNRLVVREIESA